MSFSRQPIPFLKYCNHLLSLLPIGAEKGRAKIEGMLSVMGKSGSSAMAQSVTMDLAQKERQQKRW